VGITPLGPGKRVAQEHLHCQARRACNLYHLRNLSFTFELQIILLTLLRGFSNKNAIFHSPHRCMVWIDNRQNSPDTIFLSSPTSDGSNRTLVSVFRLKRAG